MVMITKGYCGACKALKAKFAADASAVQAYENKVGNPKYGYFYPTLEEIAVSLEKVSTMYPPPSPEEDATPSAAASSAGDAGDDDDSSEDLKIDL